MASHPDPMQLRPLPSNPRLVFLKPLVQHPYTSVGEYTYYDDDAPEAFERNVLYHYGPERLVIGRYCSIATGTRFVMSGGDHGLGGVSAYPFPLLGGTWAREALDLLAARPTRGDTVVGNDVWLGLGSLVLPGVSIGDGAVVGAGAVVSRDVPPYAIVAGNPARVVRTRFEPADVERLRRAAWWDWPVELVTRHVRTIMAGDVDAVEAVARDHGLLGGLPGAGAGS